MPRFFFNAFLFLLFIYMAGCKRKQNRIADLDLQRYHELRRVVMNYGKVPHDTTLLQLESLMKTFPDDPTAWSLYGLLMYNEQRYEKAIAAYRKSTTINPRFSYPYASIGATYNMLNRIDSAQWYLDKAIALKDSDSYTFLNKAVVSLKMQNREESLLALATAMTLKPRNELLFAGCSYVYHEWKMAEESRAFYDSAVAYGLSDTVTLKRVLKGSLPMDTFYRRNNL